MKKIIIAGMLLSACVVSAQRTEPKYELESQKVKATYYYDNGQVKQQGYYDENGKPHGKWMSFNEDGSKQDIGEYTNGEKSGKWFFWTGSILNEVDYNDSRIADIKKWSKEAVVLNK